MIKIQIYQSGTNLNNFSMYTHDLLKLVTYASNLNIRLILPKYIADNLDKITGWEAGSRYDVGFYIRIDTLEKCYKEVYDWYNKLYNIGYR